ncbi:hypothetical protein D3C86_1738660 [compost metagenome]
MRHVDHPQQAIGDCQTERGQQQDRTQRQTGKCLADQVTDHQPMFHAAQAFHRFGTYRGVRLMACLRQRLQARLRFRIARAAKQAHRVEAYPGIGIVKLQIRQRDAQSLMHPAVLFQRQTLGQQRQLIALRLALQGLRRL